MSNNLGVVKLVGSSKGLDITKCIICQSVRNGRVTSEEHGREKLKRAADIRNDIVTKRLRVADEFVYHTESCYKNYTHSGRLKHIQEEKRAKEEEAEHRCNENSNNNNDNIRSMRKNVSQCNNTSEDNSVINCLICGCISHKKEIKSIRSLKGIVPVR